LPIETFEKKYPKQYNSFANSGFIIPDTFEELSMIRLKNKEAAFSSREYKLMVFPTQDCNLKCWYCYESHIADSKMSEDVMKRIIKNIEINIIKNTFDSIILSFFGGEPLMDFDKVAYPLCSIIKKMVEDAGKKFTCFFVTNGSLIDSKTIEKFKVIKPKFQITLDGNKDRHNKVRIWKNTNDPTYDTIMKAIHDITSSIENEKYFLTLRINYDNQTLKGVQGILDDIMDIDRKKIYIHFERVWQTKNKVDEEQKKLLICALKRFIKAGFVVDQGIFKGKPYACPAETSQFGIINYDGSVHKCNGRTLTKDSEEGRLQENGVIEWNEQKISKRIGLSTFENPKCLRCKMLPMCMGPCSQKLLEHGKINDTICSLNAIDISLEEYLSIDFELKSSINIYEQ
jgi:uncharacterized protein